MVDYTKILTYENAVLRWYFICIGILTLKMMLMSYLTIRQRLKNACPCSPEDENMYGNRKIIKSHEDVDRTKRAHLNDLESIPPFAIIGFAYIFTDPVVLVAIALFLSFTVTRLIHTYVYVIHVVPQPARGKAWVVGYLITGYMSFAVILHFLLY
ncbi:hypothetical protein FQR65_LT05423 [Abscondita terminalis]|nr:hypothetical protein FQR65_LT05423 [Abscondita terminalis]